VEQNNQHDPKWTRDLFPACLLSSWQRDAHRLTLQMDLAFPLF
jgi:hypothetical protein